MTQAVLLKMQHSGLFSGRRLLDGVCWVTGVLAAVFLVGIGVLILLQVAGRFFGILLPGAEDLVGWFTAAASFLALAHTFRAGTHIRVELARSSVPAAVRPWLEGAALGVTLFFVANLAYYSCEMIWESYVFGELAQGQLPVPMWIPQLGLAVGAVVLCATVADDLLRVMRGGTPSYSTNDGRNLGDERALEEV